MPAVLYLREMSKLLGCWFLVFGMGVGGGGLLFGAESAQSGQPGRAFVLWQLPNQTHSQIMSYVIRTAHEKIIVIDGGTTGDAAYLKGFLAALGNEVEAWFISHAHDDHFGALSQLLGAADAPRIKRIYGSLPDLEWVKAHGVGPQDTKPYEQLLEALRKAHQTVAELALGQELAIDGLRLEVLGVRNLEIHTNAINNSSFVLRVSDQGKSVLFTGDLGVEGGRRLLQSPYAKRLPADYLQMAHHGQDGVEESFYRAVHPSYCLWPTPDWLWDDDSGKGKGSGPWKTLEVRASMAKLSIKQHFVMTQGLIRIE
jgi:beta-lactamase superfamily II metal-dependent hydrolase